MEPWALKICCDRRPIGRVVAPLLPATAKTCCAPLCDVAPVGHQVQRQGEVTVTGRLTATRSLLVSIHCSASPRPSGLSSSHHQKCSPCAGDYLWVLCKMGVFLLGGTFSARQGTLRVCAHDLIHLSIPIAIHLHTRHVEPIVAAECPSAVVLGRERDFLVASLCSSGLFTRREAAHSLTAELEDYAADWSAST